MTWVCEKSGRATQCGVPGSTVNGVPSLLCPHTHVGCVAAPRLGVSFSVLRGLIHRYIGHAEDPRLHVETFGHLRAGVLHGHYGDLSHLIGAAGHLMGNTGKNKQLHP